MFSMSNKMGRDPVFQTNYDIRCLASSWLVFGKLKLIEGHAIVATCRPFESRRDNFIGIRAVNFSKIFVLFF